MGIIGYADALCKRTLPAKIQLSTFGEFVVVASNDVIGWSVCVCVRELVFIPFSIICVLCWPVWCSSSAVLQQNTRYSTDEWNRSRGLS